MDSETKKESKKGFLRFFSHYKHVFVYLRFSNKGFSKKALFWVNLVQTFQIFAILVPYQEDSGLPWCFEYLGSLWKMIKIACKPSILVEMMGIHSIFLSIAAMPYWAVYAFCYWKLVGEFYETDAYDFRNLISSSQGKQLLRLRRLMEMVYSKVFLIPIFYSLFENFKVLTEGASLFSFYLDLAIFLVSVCCHFIVLVLDEVLLKDVDWNSKQVESVSNPTALFGKYAFVFLLIFQDLFFDSEKFVVRRLLVSSGLGVVYCLEFLGKRPYHLGVLNFFEVVKSQLVVAFGVIGVISYLLGFEQSNVFGPLGLLLTFPILLVLSREHLKKLEAKVAQEEPSNIYQVEHCIRHYLNTEFTERRQKSESKKLDEMLKQALKRYKNNPIIYIWLINYLKQYESDKDYIKQLLTAAYKLDLGLLSKVMVFHCEVDIGTWLSKNKEEKEMIEFISIDAKTKQVLKLDQKVSMQLAELLEKREKKLVTFKNFTKELFRIMDRIHKCEKNYRELTKKDICKAFPFIFENFEGFLSCVLGKSNLADLGSQRKQAEDNLKLRRRNNEDILFIDRENFYVKVSLERHNLGKIVYCRNANVLGFTQTDLMLEEYKKLVPEPLKRHHYRWYSRIENYRHEHVLYKGIHSVFSLNREGFLMTVDWKVRLCVDTDKKLYVLVTIKPNEKFVDFALFDYENYQVTAVTEGFRRFLIEELGFSHEYQNLFEAYGVNKNMEDSQEVVRHTTVIGEVMSIRIDTVMIYGMHPLKIFGLYRLENGEWVNSNYCSDPNVLRKKGMCLYEAKKVESESFVMESMQGRSKIDEVYEEEEEAETDRQLIERTDFKESSMGSSSQKDNEADLEVLLDSMKRKAFMLRVVFLAMVVFSFGQLFVSYVMMNNDTAKIERELENLKGEKLASIMDAAILARNHQLGFSGYQNIYPEAEVKQHLQTVYDEFRASSEAFFDDALDIESEDFNNLITQRNMVWVNSDNGVVSEQRMGLMSINQKITQNLQSLVLSDSLSTTDDEFIELYLNCPNTALKQVNSTMLPYLDLKAKASKVQIEKSLYYILPSAAALYFLLILYFVWLVRNFEQVRKKLWKPVLNIPVIYFSEAKGLILQRIQESFDPDAFLETKTKGQEAFNYQMHSTMKVLIGVFCSTLVLLGVGCFLFYIEFYKVVEHNILEMPFKMNQVSLMMTEMKEVNFWLKEVSLESHKTESYRYFNSPELQFDSAMQKLNYWKNHVLTKQFLKLNSDTKIKALIFENACFETECNKYLHEGVHPGLNEFQRAAKDLKNQMLGGKQFSELAGELHTLEELQWSLSSSLNHYLELFVESIHQEVEGAFSVVLALIATLTAFQVLFYIAFTHKKVTLCYKTLSNESYFILIVRRMSHGYKNYNRKISN